MVKPSSLRYVLHDVIGDPGPMGLFAFAAVTFMGGTIKTAWKPSDIGVLFAPGFAYGGCVQLLAGFLDLLRGEVLTGSTFIAFGCNWVIQAMFHWPGLDITTTFPTSEQFAGLIGFYYMAYFFIGVSTTICVWTLSWSHFVLLILVDLIFLCDCIQSFVPSDGINKFNGYISVICALLAWYIGTAVLIKVHLGRELLPLFKPHTASRLEKEIAEIEDEEHTTLSREMKTMV